MRMPRCRYCNREMEWSTRLKEYRCNCSEFKEADTAEYNKQRQEED